MSRCPALAPQGWHNEVAARSDIFCPELLNMVGTSKSEHHLEDTLSKGGDVPCREL